MLDAGDCFFLDTNRDKDGNNQSHLFVIVLEPDGDTRETIIVNCTSINGKEKYDRTTELKNGDNGFIKKDSYVIYRKAQIVSVNHVAALIASGHAQLAPRYKYTDDAFDRICRGILKSKHTPYGVKQRYEDHLFKFD